MFFVRVTKVFQKIVPILFCRKRYVKMRASLVRFRSLVHMYVNRKQYIKVLHHKTVLPFIVREKKLRKCENSFNIASTCLF